MGMPLGQGVAAVAMGGLMSVSLWWYLYRDDAVVAFFDTLETPPEEWNSARQAAWRSA